MRVGAKPILQVRNLLNFRGTHMSDDLLSNVEAHLIKPSLAEHEMPCLNKQCRSKSVGF